MSKSDLRYREARKASLIGICLNIILAVTKFTVGFLSRSISVQADGFNNFGDAVSSLATMIGFKMSRKEADKEHPFGHGRMEYVTGLLTSLLVIIVGIEFFKSSVEGFSAVEPLKFSVTSFIVLVVSAAVKLFMAWFYRRTDKKISSPALRAAQTDSLWDAVITSVTAAAFFMSRFTDAKVDSIAGIVVSVFIVVSGVSLIRGILTPLLGARPVKESTDRIIELMLTDEHILGVHDLIIHDYGAGAAAASIHAEMPMRLTFNEIHTRIDLMEKTIKRELDVDIVIHGDPVDTSNPELKKLRYLLKVILKDINPALGYHDLRLQNDGGHTDVLFDLVVPYEFGGTLEDTENQVRKMLRQIDESYDIKIKTDRD